MFSSFAMRNTMAALLIAFAASTGCSAAARAPIPPPASDAALAQTPGKQTAVFAGGCFWGTQSVFERVKGVLSTTAGYAGGSCIHRDLRPGDPGEYRARGVGKGRLRSFTDHLWSAPAHLLFRRPRPHPAQSPGTGRRLVVPFGYFLCQRRAAEDQQGLHRATGCGHIFPKPIVTQVVPLKGFYDAESYHQDYALHNPNNPYIMVCDRPKIEALKEQFPELFKDYQGQ